MEMQIARHQYVRPVLVFSDPEKFEFDAADLSRWKWHRLEKENLPRIGIKNVGKGPAFDISLKWLAKTQLNINLETFDLSGVNDLLKKIGLILIFEKLERCYSIKIREAENDNYIASFLHTPMNCSLHFDKIEEGETVFASIPQDGMLAQILLCLHDVTQGNSSYGHWMLMPGGFEDEIEISFRSITDDLIVYHKTIHHHGGVYAPWSSETKGVTNWTMPVEIGTWFRDRFPKVR
jgi:hypothetical protein